MATNSIALFLKELKKKIEKEGKYLFTGPFNALCTYKAMKTLDLILRLLRIMKK